jgi:hypothetical protein
MAPKYSRPRLIDEGDKQYRAHLARIMLGKDNHRPTRPPRARELFGGEAEVALRTWLAERLTLSERRIVEYLEHRGRNAVTKYRELDAVALPDPKSVYVFEIKASQKAVSLRRAVQQLRDTQTILKGLFARVYTTILLVDTGIPQTSEEAREQLHQRLELLAARGISPHGPLDPPPLLDEVLAQLPQVRRIESLDAIAADEGVVGLLRFGVDEIIALAGAENLHLAWDEDDEAELEPGEEADTPRYAYSTDPEPVKDAVEPDEDNPLAAALKKAMRDRGT